MNRHREAWKLYLRWKFRLGFQVGLNKGKGFFNRGRRDETNSAGYRRSRFYWDQFCVLLAG